MKTLAKRVIPLAILALAISLAALQGAAAQTAPAVDYDSNDNGLIDVTALAQLDAMRWDLDGNGVARSAADRAKYAAAFPNPAERMGCPAPRCKGYELKNSLDFDTDGDKDVDANDAYPNWVPIGTQTAPFTATFDGGGNSITRLKVSGNRTRAGLFGRLNRATVRNLKLADADVSSSSASASSAAGALAGVMTASAVINVQSDGSVSGSAKNIGGLVGEVAGGASSAKIESSCANATVSSTGRLANVGGLAGLVNAGVKPVNMAASCALGDVSATGASAKAGGLVGLAKGAKVCPRATYALGDVSAPDARSVAGGLFGKNEAANMGVKASYAAGRVMSGGRAGGFIGQTASTAKTTASNSFWDSTASGVPDDAGAASPEGRTTAQLQNPTDASGVFAKWDMLDITFDGKNNPDDAPWDFGTRSQYPALVWRGLTAASQRADGGGATDAPAATATPTPTPTPAPRADTHVDRIYRDSAQISEYLAADRPALTASASAIFREYLLMASAAHVEKRVKTALLDHARESTGGNDRMARFIDSAITRGGGYSTLFAWDSPSAQSFWLLFGDSFGANLKDAVNGDAALTAGVAAFMKLAADRDRLMRGDIGASAYAKTSTQIHAAYESALTFAERLPRLLSENGG